jgi:methyl halide transferase
MNLDKEYWNNRYQNNETAWDLGAASAPLAAYINQLENKDLSILIPGCGNAHEAEYLVANGFTNITLIDIAPELTKKIEERFVAYPQVKVITGDFFELEGSYDLVIEQTFFCAINRAQRQAYYKKMNSILAAGGKLVGVLFASEFEREGPPFGGTQQEYLPMLQPYFHVKTLAPCYNSIPPRAGNELFIILIKK